MELKEDGLFLRPGNGFVLKSVLPDEEGLKSLDTETKRGPFNLFTEV